MTDTQPCLPWQTLNPIYYDRLNPIYNDRLNLIYHDRHSIPFTMTYPIPFTMANDLIYNDMTHQSILSYKGVGFDIHPYEKLL